MNRLSKIFSFFSILFAVVIFAFLAITLWNKARITALRPCLSNVISDLTEYPDKTKSFIQNNESWYVLSDVEAKKILKDISFGDCSYINSQPKDMKEKNVKIAVKKLGDHNFQITVWSRGFDNISGTDDDIVVPYGEKPPQF